MNEQSLNAIQNWNNRERRIYKTITVKPLTHTIGAEIMGVDLSKDVSEIQFSEIRQAWLDHLVLIFRDQNMSPEDHKRFGRKFGKLHVHPLQGLNAASDPELLEIKAGGVVKKVPGETWHTDVSCDAEPPMASMLYITEMPEGGIGGDTMFANMYLAYDLLSDRLKALLDGTTAIHDGQALPSAIKGDSNSKGKIFPRNEHPVIVRFSRETSTL